MSTPLISNFERTLLISSDFKDNPEMLHQSTTGAFKPYDRVKVPVSPHHVDDEQKSKRRHHQPTMTAIATTGLLDLYKKSNAKFVYFGTLQNPKRALSKDAKPAGNHGHDNKSCDLIIHVGDVMFPVDQARGFKFLVLDMLGQGTFGQVVKCRADWKDGGRSATATPTLIDDEMMASSTAYGSSFEEGGMPSNKPTRPRMVAVKVVKNKPAYHNQAKVEIKVLKKIDEEIEPTDKRGNSLIRLLYDFEFNHHLCLVFELMSVNLYELIKHQEFRGLPFEHVRSFASQLLDALDCLNELKIIHCDLKPENILLENFCDPANPKIKLIDLGSACYENATIYSYIQSRFYRAPEVILGVKYGLPIDMWSLGCVCVELFMGLPVFPGVSAHNQLARIIEMLGMPPDSILDEAKKTKTFFNKIESNTQINVGFDGDIVLKEDYFASPVGEGGNLVDMVRERTLSVGQVKYPNSNKWKIKTAQEWAFENGLKDGPEKTKRYVKEKTLIGVIAKCESKRRPKNEPVENLSVSQIDGLIDFCSGLLQLDFRNRWTPKQAMKHPFITKDEFFEPFNPVDDEEEEVDDDEMEEEALTIDDGKRERPNVSHAMPIKKPKRKREREKEVAFSPAAASLSSVAASPITRAENPYPLAHGSKWSDLGTLTSPLSQPASSVYQLPSLSLSTQSTPRQREELYGRSLPNTQQVLGSPKVETIRQVSEGSTRTISFRNDGAKMLAPPPVFAGGFEVRKSPSIHVEKTLENWTPFNKDSMFLSSASSPLKTKSLSKKFEEEEDGKKKEEEKTKE